MSETTETPPPTPPAPAPVQQMQMQQPQFVPCPPKLWDMIRRHVAMGGTRTEGDLIGDQMDFILTTPQRNQEIMKFAQDQVKVAEDKLEATVAKRIEAAVEKALKDAHVGTDLAAKGAPNVAAKPVMTTDTPKAKAA
jgi:hypothetical protein